MDVNSAIEIFANRTLYYIENEYETAKVNFVFLNKEAFANKNLKITDDELNHLLNPEIDDEAPTIYVKDSELFFYLLTKLINAQNDLNVYYGEANNPEGVANRLMRRLWLRMSPDDFQDVISFLETEISFLENRMFDNPKTETVISNPEFKITYEVEECETWCESTRRMCFRIYNQDEYHDLPRIYYDLKEENGEIVCYIPAVQMPTKRHRDKKVERSLYKLNKGITNPKVHPNFLMAMKLFYEFLNARGITHIKVPTLQVLNYRYHTVLSNEGKESMAAKWPQDKVALLEKIKKIDFAYYETLKKEYEDDLEWLEHISDKEDQISRNKTEGLIDLFMEMPLIYESTINTEPFINASYLDITLGKKNERTM